MKKTKNILTSVNFKITIIVVLTFMTTLQIVSTFLGIEIKKQSLSVFREQMIISKKIKKNITKHLNETNNNDKISKNIYNILSNINNTNIDNVEVIDKNYIVRGNSNIKYSKLIGTKNNTLKIQQIIKGSKKKIQYITKKNKDYYQIIIKPLKNNKNQVIGVYIVKGDLTDLYKNFDGLINSYFISSIVGIVFSAIMSVLISNSIIKPIELIKNRTNKIADGDYSGDIKIINNDEISQLANNVNVLAHRIEETTNSMEFEKRRLDSVLEHMTDGVIATNRNGDINLINSSALNFTRKTLSSSQGKSILDVLNIRDKYKLREVLDEHEELMIDFSTEQETLVTMAYFSLIEKASGFVSGIVIVLHDVTEQQKIDIERKTFVSNVSHELRTPLTSVKSYIDALQDGAIEDKEMTHNFLKVVQDETERMNYMINDLLDLSRMDFDNMILDIEVVNINKLLNHILNRFDMIISNEDKPKKRYYIERNIKISEAWIEIDTSRFTQVIDNLINNAIKYSPNGGIITIKMYSNKNNIIISINDQGLGIPQKDIKNIFERFFRVDKARSRKQGGSGLGLAISKEIVKKSGGKIWVESKENEGSTFYVSFPYIIFDDNDEWNDK